MRMCKRPRNANSKGTGRRFNRGGLRRVNLIGQATDQSEGSSEWDEDNVVLRLDGIPPFVLKGRINKQPFTTMIDSGSPFTIFTLDDVRKILKTDVIFARPLPKNEAHVDYDGKPLKLIGFINVDVQVGKRTIKRAQIVIARDRKRSLVRRDWLTQLTYRVAEASKESKCANFVNKIESKIELSPELKSIQQKFPKIFSRQGKITRHTIKNESKKGVRITQQKGRRVPLPPQTAVDAEVRSLLAAGHIKRIDKITDDMFIQPVVIRVKNDTCQNSARCQVAQYCHIKEQVSNAKSGEPNGESGRNSERQQRRRSVLHLS